VRAAVRVTYTKAGAEHDVVLMEAPPSPELFGLPQSSRLEVWHEIVEGPELESVGPSRSTNGPPAAVTVPYEDRGLALGSMRLAEGRAFSVEGNDSDGV
jgi:hypothetical protein